MSTEAAMLSDELITAILLHEHAELDQLIDSANTPHYLDESQCQIDRLPAPLTRQEQLWQAIRFQRHAHSVMLPFLSEKGYAYTLFTPAHFTPILQKADQHLAGPLWSDAACPHRKELEYLKPTLIEEAAAITQKSKGTITKEEAEKLIYENRSPKSKDEKRLHSIVQVQEQIHSDLLSSLNMDTVLAWQHTLLRKKQGASQSPGLIEANLLQLTSLINWLNDSADCTHPILKAIIARCIILLHPPFKKEKEALASLIMYWTLRVAGYWAFSHLPLTAHLLYYQDEDQRVTTLSKDGDLTYEVELTLLALEDGIDKLQQRLENSEKKEKVFQKLSHSHIHFNERQIKLLQHFFVRPKDHITITEHRRRYQITRVTAASDLNELLEQGYLSSEKKGRYRHYLPTPQVKELFLSLKTAANPPKQPSLPPA